MSYPIKLELDRNEAHKLTVPYDADGEAIASPGEKADPGKPVAGELVFYLWPRWRGRHTRRINDAMYANDTDGKVTPRFGSGAREKILCGVVSIEGLTDASGRAVEKMDRDVYGWLPASILEHILGKLNELNSGQKETDEGE